MENTKGETMLLEQGYHITQYSNSGQFKTFKRGGGIIIVNNISKCFNLSGTQVLLPLDVKALNQIMNDYGWVHE